MKAKTKITNALRAGDLMRAGGTLTQMHTHTGLCWFIVPGGEVSAAIAAGLLKRPDVQPSGDGLFRGISQTYRLGAVPSSATKKERPAP